MRREVEFMKKYVMSIMVLMVLACITGCGNETTNDNNSNNNSNNYSFNDLEKDLKSLDSDIQINKKEASLIGANEGYGDISKKTLLHELAHIELNQLCQIDKDLFAFHIEQYEDEANRYIKEIMKGSECNGK